MGQGTGTRIQNVSNMTIKSCACNPEVHNAECPLPVSVRLSTTATSKTQTFGTLTHMLACLGCFKSATKRKASFLRVPDFTTHPSSRRKGLADEPRTPRSHRMICLSGRRSLGPKQKAWVSACGCGSKPRGSHFGWQVNLPPILEPILVGIGMFT